MSFVQSYSRWRGVSVVIPSDIVRYVYFATAAVVILGLLREAFVFQMGTETVLQDLRHFALDAERNLGAWYSSALMVLIAACAMVNKIDPAMGLCLTAGFSFQQCSFSFQLMRR